jgi:hypothetical protein
MQEKGKRRISLKLNSRSSSISRSSLLTQLCIHNSISSYQSLPPQRRIQGTLAIVVCWIYVVEEVVDYFAMLVRTLLRQQSKGKGKKEKRIKATGKKRENKTHHAQQQSHTTHPWANSHA